MKIAVFSFLCCLLLSVSPAHAASSSDAREVARLNNCTPKKIEVAQQTLGTQGATFYRVSCNLPKTKDESAASMPDAILVKCDGSLCEFVRSVKAENK